ncbi:uncharacterized protein LOC111203278 [Brassica napus]|uniref:uncharacterized protein LOC111203278 n=1 Tax=Brassica napus TaxID=3708 RepID=UPI000BBF14F2|nr:uncharacterized protein LOC111203278 [Brassica napus]
MTAPAPSRFRPPPDPPPCKLFWFESLSPTIPPDPPDPPDASSVLALFRFLNAAASLSSHAFPKIQDLESHSPILTSKMRGGDTHHLSVGVSSFVSGRLCTAGCSLLYHRRTVWSPFRSCPDVLFQVCLCASLSVHYSVEWYETWVVWEALDMRLLVLICDVPMESFSLGSTLVLIEETLSMIFLLLKPVETSTFLLGVSCLEQSIFPIFPHVWSELDEQALLVLQGFSSQLVHFSAFEAVIVTLWSVCLSVWLAMALLYTPVMEFKLVSV